MVLPHSHLPPTLQGPKLHTLTLFPSLPWPIGVKLSTWVRLLICWVYDLGRVTQAHCTSISSSKVGMMWDVPGGPVVKTLPSNAGGVGLIPVREDKTSHALKPKKPKTYNRSSIVTNFYVDFKRMVHKKKKKLRIMRVPSQRVRQYMQST